jgi:hypothetical protein
VLQRRRRAPASSPSPSRRAEARPCGTREERRALDRPRSTRPTPGACGGDATRGTTFSARRSSWCATSSCPVCAVARNRSPPREPGVAAEWHPVANGDVTADAGRRGPRDERWWQCPKGHEYQATVRSRARANRRCPTCYGGWSIESLRKFVKSLLGHVRALNPSELFALAMQAGAFADKDSRPFVMADLDRQVPGRGAREVRRGPAVARGRRSPSNKDFSLENVDGRSRSPKTAPPSPSTRSRCPTRRCPSTGRRTRRRRREP